MKKKYKATESRFSIEAKRISKRIKDMTDYQRLKQDELSIPANISHLLRGGENSGLKNIKETAIALEVNAADLFD